MASTCQPPFHKPTRSIYIILSAAALGSAQPINMANVTRYQPCYMLGDNNVPCVIWCEDALAHYGVPTIVFSLCLLVPDIDQAAEILIQEGWHPEDETKTRFGNSSLQSAHHRLTPPGGLPPRAIWSPEMGPPPLPSKKPPGPTTTILLPASEWNYEFPENNDHYNFVPLLPALLDGLIDKLLDDPLADSIFWHYLAVLIGYLYGHVPALKQKEFAEELKYDHRQFHYDYVSGMFTGLPFIRHQQKIREALRNNTYQLSDCSVDRDNESSFLAKAEARLLALTTSLSSSEAREAEA